MCAFSTLGFEGYYIFEFNSYINFFGNPKRKLQINITFLLTEVTFLLINQTVYFKFEEIRLTFLTGHSDDSKKRIRQLIVQQLAAIM